MSIPKFIHQIWGGPHNPPADLMLSWRNMNPTWVYRLWTDLTGWKNQAQIDGMSELCGKADIIRYEILEKWGGVYVDADALCLKPLDGRFTSPECWAAYENEVCRPGVIANGMLGAEPNSDLMADLVLACSHADVRNLPAWRATGPTLLTQVAKRHPELEIFPAKTFYPKHWSGVIAPGDSPTYAEQYWASTNGLYPKLAGEVT